MKFIPLKTKIKIAVQSCCSPVEKGRLIGLNKLETKASQMDAVDWKELLYLKAEDELTVDWIDGDGLDQ